MRISRGAPEARSRLCVCRASFLMTFAMGRVPHAGPQQVLAQGGISVLIVAGPPSPSAGREHCCSHRGTGTQSGRPLGGKAPAREALVTLGRDWRPRGRWELCLGLRFCGCWWRHRMPGREPKEEQLGAGPRAQAHRELQQRGRLEVLQGDAGPFLQGCSRHSPGQCGRPGVVHAGTCCLTQWSHRPRSPRTCVFPPSVLGPKFVVCPTEGSPYLF